MALNDIPNKLLQSPKPHDTCPLQQHQVVLHPKHQIQENEKQKHKNKVHLKKILDEYPANISKFFE